MNSIKKTTGLSSRASKAINFSMMTIIACAAHISWSNLHAASGSWNVNANGNWSTSTNWLSDTIGDGVNATVNFTNDITGNRSITVDANTSRTMGILNIGDSNGSHNFTINNTGSTGVLIFDTGSATNAQLNFSGKTNTISAPIQLANSLDINNSTNNNQAFGSISASTSGLKIITNSSAGSGGIVQSFSTVISDGSGQVAIRQNSSTSTLVLNGSNTYTGNTTLDAGSIGVQGGSSLGTGTVVLNGGTLYNSNTSTASVNNEVTLGGNVTFIGTTGGTSATTRLALGGNITLTGSREITVDGVTNANGGGYVTFGGGNITESGGSYSFTKKGNGTLVLAMASGKAISYTGGTYVNDGVLRLGTASGLATLPTAGAVTIDGGALDIATTNITTNNVGALSLVSGSITNSSGTSTLTASGYTVSSGSASAILAGASSALTKNSAGGTVTLSRANTYAGGTTVSAGTLLVTNTTGSGLGAGAVTVQNTGILGGTGTIALGSTNTISVQSGAVIASGVSGIGTLILDGGSTSGATLTMNSGATFSFDLGTGNTSDLVKFYNYAGASDFVRNNNVLNFTGAQTGTYTLFQFYSNSGTTLTASGITSGLNIGSGLSGFSYSLNYNANDISLVVSTVPEPSQILLIGMAGAFFFFVVRKRS